MGKTDYIFRRLIKRRGDEFFLFFLVGLLITFGVENTFAQKKADLPPEPAPVLKRRPLKISSNQDDFVKGCGETSTFWTCGRVIDADGKPVAGIDVEMSSAYYEKGSPLYYSAAGLTDENGYFKGLHYTAKPDAYVISIRHLFKPNDDYPFPTAFYPNAKTKKEAEVFILGSDDLFEPITFQLPPRLVKQKFSLTVRYEDGSAAEQVTASLENTRHDYYESYGGITDENGFIEFEVFAGDGYQVKVTAEKSIDGKEVEYYGESDIFDLNSKMNELELILKKTN